MPDDRPVPYRRPGSLLYFFDVQRPDGSCAPLCLDTAELEEARRLAAGFQLAQAPQNSPPPASEQGPRGNDGVESRLVTGSVHWALVDHLQRRAPDLAEATRGMYAGQAGTLARILGERLIYSLTHEDIQQYTAARLEERVSRETVRKELVLLRSALRTAHFVGHRVPDLLLLFPKLAADYVPRKRWLTPEQFFALAELLAPHRRRYLYVACYTGGRRSELEALQWKDIDWTRDAVHLRGTKTDQAARHVPLHPHLAAYLRREFTHSESRVLQRWPNVCRDLAARCESLGIAAVTPNDLRRTFGSWLVQQNVSAHIVAKLMGHTTEKMVSMVYGHLDDHALRRAVAHLPTPE